MTYLCPKGHQSTDSDYCSECGALIGQSKIGNVAPMQTSASVNLSPGQSGGQEICPDCGTPRTKGARFCEVCRHDFQENKTGLAEVIVASKQTEKPVEDNKSPLNAQEGAVKTTDNDIQKASANTVQKLNVLISIDNDKAAAWDGESPIKPDTRERVFPLDLDENLVGRRSVNKGIYPEIEINDPGVSHRHLKFIKQPDGKFAVLELGSSNGTELNGKTLDAGINTIINPGDELTIGIWTRLKITPR